MVVASLFVQSLDGTMVALHSTFYLSTAAARVVAVDFHHEMLRLRRADGGDRSLLGGCVVLAQQHSAHYTLLNELYVVVVASVGDNPFEAKPLLARARAAVLAAAGKGAAVSLLQVLKKQGELHFALQRVLAGDEGVELVERQKLLSTAEYAPSAGAWRLAPQRHGALAPDFALDWTQTLAAFQQGQRNADMLQDLRAEPESVPIAPREPVFDDAFAEPPPLPCSSSGSSS